MSAPIETKIMGEKHWTKRSKESGQFIDKKDKGKFKWGAARTIETPG